MQRKDFSEMTYKERKAWFEQENKKLHAQNPHRQFTMRKLSELPALDRNLLNAGLIVDGKKISREDFKQLLSQTKEWSDTQMCLMIVKGIPESFECFKLEGNIAGYFRVDLPPECLNEFLTSKGTHTIEEINIISNYDAKAKHEVLEIFNEQKKRSPKPN